MRTSITISGTISTGYHVEVNGEIGAGLMDASVIFDEDATNEPKAFYAWTLSTPIDNATDLAAYLETVLRDDDRTLADELREAIERGDVAPPKNEIVAFVPPITGKNVPKVLTVTLTDGFVWGGFYGYPFCEAKRVQVKTQRDIETLGQLFGVNQ